MRNLILMIFIFATMGATAKSQGLSPLIQVMHANKHGHASGTFQVVNGTLAPLATTLEVKGFVLDEAGHSQIADLPANVHVALDATSARIPPQSSHTFSFAVDCQGPCQFRVLTFDGSAKHTDGGMSVKTVIAETIYVEGPEPLKRDDVTASWMNPHTLVLTNHSPKMERATPNDVRTGGKTQPYADFTLEPLATRVVSFDSKPDSIVIHFEHFKIETTPAQ